jgi:hypothetical protein
MIINERNYVEIDFETSFKKNFNKIDNLFTKCVNATKSRSFFEILFILLYFFLKRN